MISSAPGTIGEEAASVASGQVCARQTENMTQREGERPAVFSWLFLMYTASHLAAICLIFLAIIIYPTQSFDWMSLNESADLVPIGRGDVVVFCPQVRSSGNVVHVEVCVIVLRHMTSKRYSTSVK